MEQRSSRPRLTDTQRTVLQTLTMHVLLELRALFLASGASPLSHWDQIESRLQASTRTSASVEEWLTSMKRGLRLVTTSSSLSSAAVRLADEVALLGPRGALVWLDMVSREVGYLMAITRLEAEDRRAQKAADDARMREIVEEEMKQ